MPKRGGGGNNVQRHNNNSGNGGGGNATVSRFSALKDADDYQRRKGRDKRRVSFKTSQFTHKSDHKLRAQDVRRWEEDDDMVEMTTTVKARPSAHRRGSPIPRGKFGKLLQNPAGWYQVTIHNGQIYDKETLLRALLAAMSPHVFIPQYWRTERSCVVFFTDDFEVAERILQLGRNAQLPDGFRLMPRVRSGFPLVIIDDELKSKMKLVMSKRYNVQTKALDMSRFHADQDLKPLFCPLFRVNVMNVAIDIMVDNIPDVEAINLNENQLSTLEAFKSVEKRLPHLKIIYLGDNKLPSLAHLLVLRNLSIVEMVLQNNPCRLRYKDTSHFISEVRIKFPKLRKLDGEILPPTVGFDVESNVLPTTKASFLVEAAGGDIIRQFLDQYFTIFDSGNRQPLLDAYHEHIQLSMSMPSVNQTGSRLNSFWKFNRNFRRVVTNDRDDYRTRLLKCGRLACVSMLDEWPRTLHERSTFTVDLTVFNPQFMVFTVTGLFRELTGEPNSSTPIAAQPYELRHFMRTFVVVPQNTGYCILNESILLVNATNEQQREFKRSLHAPPAVPAMAMGVVSPAAASIVAPPTLAGVGGNTALQNRLQQGQTAAAGPVAHIPQQMPVASTMAPTPINDDTKMQMVQAMCAHSQMNVEWSRKCLEETNWDYNQAAFVFEKLFKESKIPPEAFVK